MVGHHTQSFVIITSLVFCRAGSVCRSTFRPWCWCRTSAHRSGCVRSCDSSTNTWITLPCPAKMWTLVVSVSLCVTPHRVMLHCHQCVPVSVTSFLVNCCDCVERLTVSCFIAPQCVPVSVTGLLVNCCDRVERLTVSCFIAPQCVPVSVTGLLVNCCDCRTPHCVMLHCPPVCAGFGHQFVSLLL